MTQSSPEWLTAAECAVRTGVTVRALRVYENQGLIKPGRSAAGWRRYGVPELLRLNQIALLKVLGLTLTQIRDLMRRPASPSLRDLLEMQLSAWAERRKRAEYGQAAAHAALQRLHTSGSLSLEELCSLIRSVDPVPIADEPSPSLRDSDLQVLGLDRFVGHYLRNPALGVSTISRNGDRLVLRSISQREFELEQTGESEFVMPVLDLVLSFEQIERGNAHHLAVWPPQLSTRLSRTDEATATAVTRQIVDRIRAGVPSEGSADALRLVLDGIRMGTPNYSAMSTELASVVRERLVPWQMLGQYFGAVRSVEFVGVTRTGWDTYQVKHEHDVQRYRIALGDDEKVYGFTEASASAEDRAVF